ncbi:MAG: hypothetical protein L7H18_05060 [Candidatus Nealsonbacteria bacterium DGGOD1a]|nr:MAG: hypothetical protein L7H18_05060 [Candidatus Nealsonbacteria bacterium DGGOD1a]
MKNKYVCNLRPQGLPALGRAVKSGKRKIAGDKELMKGFLKSSELYLYDIQSIMRRSIV